MKYSFLLFINVLFIYNLSAQDIIKDIDLKNGLTVKVENANQEIFITSSATKFKSKVITKISSKSDILNDSLVISMLMPIIDGYDYDFDNLKSETEHFMGKPILLFSSIRRSEGFYVLTIPLVQSLSSFTERRKIYIAKVLPKQ